MVRLVGVKRNRQKLLKHRTIPLSPWAKLYQNLIAPHVRTAGDFKKRPVLGGVETTEVD